MSQGISYKTPAFEGPLDLLLFLIQKAEVNIYDIPIAEITEQFLDYMGREEVVPLGQMSDFCKMASDLLWIKSRMLLPVEVKFDEEYEDPRQELAQRLLDYQKFKKYSQILVDSEKYPDFRLDRKKLQFMLPFTDQELWENVGVEDLLKTYVRLLENIEKYSSKVFNAYEEVTVNQKIALLNELLENYKVVHFAQVVVKTDSPAHIVSAFMAVLECVGNKIILIKQAQRCGDIEIVRRPENYVFKAHENE